MKKFDPKSLPYIGAAAQAVLFTFAGVKAYAVWGWVIGPGVGAVASLSTATAAAHIGSITAKGRKRLGYACLFLMALVSPATIGLSIATGDTWYTAVAWGLAVDVSIVLAGVITGKGFVKQDDNPPQPGETVSTTTKPRKTTRTKVVKKPIEDSELLSWFAANPGTTDAEVAQHFGVSPQAIGKRRRKLYEVKQ